MHGAESDSDSEDEKKPTTNGLLVDSQHKSLIIQIDDEQDEDLLLSLDNSFPDNFQFCNIENPNMIIGSENWSIQMFTILKSSSIGMLSHHPNRQLSFIFKQLYQQLSLQLSFFDKCIVAGLNYDIQPLEDTNIIIRLTAVAMGQSKNNFGDDKGICGQIVLSETSPFDGLEKSLMSYAATNDLSRSTSFKGLDPSGTIASIIHHVFI